MASRDRIREIVAAQLGELHQRRGTVLDQLDLDRLETLAKIAAVADKLEEEPVADDLTDSRELEERLLGSR